MLHRAVTCLQGFLCLASACHSLAHWSLVGVSFTAAAWLFKHSARRMMLQYSCCCGLAAAAVLAADASNSLELASMHTPVSAKLIAIN
jgi:hypothetical protein